MPKKKAVDTLVAPSFFFSESYELSYEEMEKIVSLLIDERFRIYEKYLLRKQSRKAHAMVSTEDDGRMKDLKAQIRGIGEITADHKKFWEAVKNRTEPPKEEE